jgi:hypothetical protein
MEAFLTIAAVAASNIVCFMIGAKVGQAVSKGEEVKLPNLNPLEAVREHKAKKEAEYQQSKIDTILSNIDSYDGTGNGQKDIPRG